MPRLSGFLAQVFAPVLVLLGLALPTGECRAAANANARIALHLLPVAPGGACTNSAARPACSGVISAGRTEPTEYFAYVLVMNGDRTSGIGGVQFGIDYDNTPNQGVDIFYWVSCTTLQFPMPTWPQAGSGNLLTWNIFTGCERSEPGGPGTGVVAVVGYFYLGAYTPDILRITPRPADGLAKVADCTPLEDILEGGGVHHDPSFLGSAAFSSDGATPGHNPCDAVTPSCAISGPSSVFAGTGGNLYQAPAVGGARYAWSVTGAATLPGPTDLPEVTVVAGSGASFTLALEISVSGASASCRRTIPILAPTCSIGGAAAVDPGTTQSYSAFTNLPSPVYSWALSGNAAFAAPPAGATIQVVAGAAGTYRLDVAITSPAGSRACFRIVTVNQPGCVINGPTGVAAGTSGNSYAVAGTIGTSWSWTLVGNGTLVGPTDRRSVEVLAGPTGNFELSVDESQPGGLVTCRRTIIVAEATCSLSGPSAAEPGSTVTYSVATNLPAPAYLWSVTGDGTITGAANGASVQILAGAGGAFEVACDVAGGGVGTRCARSCTVESLVCAITGPTTVAAHTPGVAYGVITPYPDASYSWTIIGNASFAGPAAGPTVSVNVGAPGTFALGLQVTRSGRMSSCSFPVVVSPSGGGGPGRNAEAKLLLHVLGRAAKNPCTRAAATVPCAQVNTRGDLYPELYLVYLLVAEAAESVGVAGLEVGLEYDGGSGSGIDIFSWTNCASFESQTAGWPLPTSGIRILWDTPDRCQRTEPGGPGTGVVANAGFFYLAAYSSDRLRLVPHTGTQGARVLDCDGGDTLIEPRAGIHPWPLGIADFSAGSVEPGYNPCRVEAVSVRATTWSAIKAMYHPPAPRAREARRE